ncbi:hypothetical protein ACFE04_031343 [Oxalis oulophora]
MASSSSSSSCFCNSKFLVTETNSSKLKLPPLPNKLNGSQKSVRVVAYHGLKNPPYKLDALEPYISKKTIEIHWGKHHRAYLDKLNNQLGKNDILYGYTMDQLVKATYNNGSPLPEFNNAAQVWNHDFFWESMQPGGGDMPKLGLLRQIEKDFGSFTNFREKFITAALALFGSGWVWLVLKREEKRLEIITTSNAVNPLVWDDIPIICLDMWEHAYYLDYKNDKASYVNAFMDHLVSWNSAMSRMARAEAFVNLGEPTIPGDVKPEVELTLLIGTVFSLNNYSWRVFPVVIPPPRYDMRENSTSFNSLVHFMYHDDGELNVFAFDVSSEVYQVMKLPENLTGDNECLNVSAFKDYTIGVCYSLHGLIDMWVMMEYGNFASWRKMLSFDLVQNLNFEEVDMPQYTYCFRKNGELFLQVHWYDDDSDYLIKKVSVLLDPQKGENKFIVKDSDFSVMRHFVFLRASFYSTIHLLRVTDILNLKELSTIKQARTSSSFHLCLFF